MDMKKILQTMDGVKAKAEVDSSGMKKFLTIVESSKNITNPVPNVPVSSKPSAIDKYVKQVEQELNESVTRTNKRARQLAERVIERIVPNADGSLPDPSINRLTGKPNPPAAEPAPSNLKPGGATVEYGGETYDVMVFGDKSIRPRIARSDKVVSAKVYTMGNKMFVLLDAPAQEGVAEDSDPCWDSHKMVGTKKKGGKTVPNCVPKEAVNTPQQKLNTKRSGQAAQPAPVGKPRCLKWTYSGQWPNQVVTCVTWDRPVSEEEASKASLGSVLQWPEVVKKVNGAMKATGWKGQRQSDDAFMYSTKGQETDDQFYFVIIDNAGEGFFRYALGTVEDGDPHIDDAFKGQLPNTEASVSELLNMIRDGFGLSEAVPKLSKHISQSKLPPDSLNKRAKNQAIKRLK